MPKLIICRGLPGSGKSTTAKRLYERLMQEGFNACTESADYFFQPFMGGYRYNKDHVPEAHWYCKASVAKALAIDGYNIVIVDNTNIKQEHYQYYIDLAKKYDYDVEFLIPNTMWAWDVDECFKRNTHGVPKETIQRMKDQYEPDNRYPQVRLPFERDITGAPV